MKSCVFALRGLGRAVLMALWLCGAIALTPVFAASPADELPGRVGRLSVVEGAVWRFCPDENQWVSAERNRPLTTGDRLSTDASGRAEWRVGSTAVRLDSGTEIALLRLDDAHLQLQLQRGSVVVRLRDNDRASEFELVTAEGSFRIGRAGQYRFDRQGDHSQATVWSGQAQFTGRNQALTIDSGQRAEFFVGAGGRVQYAIVDPVADAFSAWSDQRDRTDRAQSQPYVSPEMTGAEELDRYGRWQQDPEYGPLWFPQDVGPGWAPYSVGNWVWVEPWGWTWVDAAPWGFAPFHYGRWVQRGSMWGWAPGRYEHRPVYAPALVGWVGGPPPHRPGVDINISIGRGGPRNWYPLGPRDNHERWMRDDSRDSRFERERDRDDRDARQPRPPERPQPLPRADQGRGAPRDIGAPPPGAAGRGPGALPPLPNRPRDDDRRDRRSPEPTPGAQDRPAAPVLRAPGVPPATPQVMPAPALNAPPPLDHSRDEDRRDRRPGERAPGFDAPPATAPARAPVFNPPTLPQVIPPPVADRPRDEDRRDRRAPVFNPPTLPQVMSPPPVMAPPVPDRPREDDRRDRRPPERAVEAPPVPVLRAPVFNAPARVEPPPAPPPRVMQAPPPPPAPPREMEQRRPEPVRGMEQRRPEPPRDEADQRRQRPAPVFPGGSDDPERERRRAN
ncbi:MAG: hypothetical protein B7Y51_01960 [Burkholderiales bacterium 28-67-8]|nr:MAG: hypothetical protein B7Y51_01960 [Burkholderiales bacterium 28-67-8]